MPRCSHSDWLRFSRAGQSTYFGFINAIKELGGAKPKLIMLENVTGFLTSKGGADFVRAVTTLAELGYWVDTVVLDAKMFVPQSRPRVFVIGFHESLQSSRIIRQGHRAMFGDAWQTAIDDAGALRPSVLLKLMVSTSLPTGWATLSLRPPKQAQYNLVSIIDTTEDQDWWDQAANDKHYAMLSDL